MSMLEEEEEEEEEEEIYLNFPRLDQLYTFPSECSAQI